MKALGILFAVLLSCVALITLNIPLQTGGKLSILERLAHLPPRGGVSYSKRSDLEHQQSTSVLFLGSSHAYRGFDSEILSALNIRFFNLGTPAQGPLSTEFILQQFLERLAPKVIVYELYWLPFELDGVESALDLCQNSWLSFDRPSAIFAFRLKSLGLLRCLAVNAVKKLMANTHLIWQEPTPLIDEEYKFGGYVKSLSNTRYLPQTAYPTHRIHENSDQLESFKRVLSVINQSKTIIKVIFVTHPLPKQTFDRIQGLDRFYANLSTIITDKLASKPFRFSKAEYFENSLFVDDNHLSADGAKFFTKGFAQKNADWLAD